jgi:hypothetical protein
VPCQHGTAVPVTIEDIELAIERALKKARVESEVSISAMSEVKWSLLADAARLQLQPIQLQVVGLDDTKLPKVPAFFWSDESEGQQADRWVVSLYSSWTPYDMDAQHVATATRYMEIYAQRMQYVQQSFCETADIT